MELRDYFGELRIDLPPLWVRPTLVVEIEFRERTSDGLRHAVFIGVSPGKSARQRYRARARPKSAQSGQVIDADRLVISPKQEANVLSIVKDFLAIGLPLAYASGFIVIHANLGRVGIVPFGRVPIVAP